MEIFILENQIVRPTREILMVFPFDEVWYRDVSEHKTTALAEFAYVEFLISPKKANPFYGYPNQGDPHKSERAKKIIENKFRNINLDWQPDELVKQCVLQYQEFIHNASPRLKFYESARGAAQKLEDFFNDFDMTEKTKSGTPVYKPRDITTALIDTKAVLTNLASLEEQVHEDLYTTAKTKGNKVINDDFER